MTDYADDAAEVFFQYERIDAGSYVVVGLINVDGRMEERRIPCRNPAWAFAQLEEELCDLLAARERARLLVSHRRAQ